MSEQLPSKILDELDDEYLRIINPIITNEEFIINGLNNGFMGGNK